MATPVHDKYFLKSLHEEIDLFDRKLAHMLKYDTEGSEAERKVSASKMAAKRETLARTARQLVNDGIEFKPSDLPRSFRSADAVPAEVVQENEIKEFVATMPDTVNLSPAARPVGGKRSASPFAGTVLDGQAAIADYKRNRVKASAPQA